MTENDFFIAILRATPDNSFVETTGFVDYDTAEKIGLIKFNIFRPESVGLAFNLTSKNREFWIDYFKNKDINQDLVHYCIYHNDSIISNGVDGFFSNTFDKNYYKDNFSEFRKDFEFDFEENLTSNFPAPERLIEFIETYNYQENYSLDILTKITDRNLKLRFAIEKIDFDNLTLLLNEIKPEFRLEFHGAYMNKPDSVECGLLMIRSLTKIDLRIKVTKKLMSNLVWFQQLDNEKEIERMII